MVTKARLLKMIEAYRLELRNMRYNLPNRRSSLTPKEKRLVRTKKTIIDFYLANNAWPRRKRGPERERSLGVKFENYISKESLSFDPSLRDIAIASGRKSNNKRKHAVRDNKALILEFIEKYGRVPTTKKGEKIPGESTLRSKLDYYTQEMNDMSFLGTVYSMDRCHKSGVPSKFRPVINDALNIQAPLIRLSKSDLKGE